MRSKRLAVKVKFSVKLWLSQLKRLSSQDHSLRKLVHATNELR
jgi:hypothetical protein